MYLLGMSHEYDSPLTSQLGADPSSCAHMTCLTFVLAHCRVIHLSSRRGECKKCLLAKKFDLGWAEISDEMHFVSL